MQNQLRQDIKNVAVETGRTFQDLLGSYGMERTLWAKDYSVIVKDWRVI